MTSLAATTTDAGTHSIVVTTTKGPTKEYDSYLTDYDSSEESYRDYDIPSRRRRDGDQGRGTQHRSRKNNPDPRGPTNEENENKIRAFKEQIALLRGDIVVVGPRMYCRRGEGLNAMLINLNLDLTTN